MLKLLSVAFLLVTPAVLAQCSSCNSGSGYGASQQPSYQSTGSTGSSSSNNQPGYLPDYQGDKYTNTQRIQETQALNKAFFDSIGGAPSPPPPVPAASGPNVWQQYAYSANGGSGSTGAMQGNMGSSSQYPQQMGTMGMQGSTPQMGRRRRFARHLSQ